MPVHPDLLNCLQCPHSRQTLILATEAELSSLNQRIEEGSLKHFNQKLVDSPLKEALITADKTIAYRVDDDIPIMLPDSAIRISEPSQDAKS